ncbi:MAG: hypothetical protein HOP32_11635 [Nitrospira sp.]|nr:hypothetical protein [Nitrospira sp.]
MRYRETSRVVMVMVYLSALCTAALHSSLSPEEGRAQPTTEIESSIPLLPLQPPALVKPLPTEELSKLNAIARKAIEKSPIQSKTVVGIHHALLDSSVVQQVLKSNPTNSAPKVIIELPNKQSAVIVTDSLQAAQDSVLWKGHVENPPGNRVRFIVNAKNNAINGSIEKGRFIYEIRPSPSNTNVLEILAIDPSGFPPEHGGFLPDHGSLRPPPASVSSVVGVREDRVTGPLILTAGSSPPVIDVMILYTTDARNQDPNGIGAMACLAVEDLKEALTNSGVQATARLVHHGIAGTFTEASDRNIDSNLESLRTAGNTLGYDIFLLRNAHAADVVSLWVSDANGTDCGMSPGLDVNKTPKDFLAFSVVKRECARSNRSFVHEVGHILQANHDRYQEEAGNILDYNYGYVKPDKGWMTVMSYHRPDCPLEDILDSGGNPVFVDGVKQQRHACNRRLNWSNPLVSDLGTGDSMGRPQGTSTNDCTNNRQQPPINCDGPADNARVLNSTVATVAGFRTGGSLGNVLCVPPDVIAPKPPIGLEVH